VHVWQIIPEKDVFKSCDLSRFLEISGDTLDTVQERDIVSMEDYWKSYVAYRMALLTVTLR